MKVTGALLTLLALSACDGERAQPASERAQVEIPVNRLASDDARRRGRALFVEKCALCHGERGDGNGARSKGLSRKPANFRSPSWRASVTPAYVYQVLREGKRGTSMPAWPTLSEDQTWDVIAYVLSAAEDGP